MAIGLFEQLSWLTTRVKRLCCAVKELQQGGGSSYKVYTALLTQTGGDELYELFGGELTIGVTYTISVTMGNPDWTNVGAPNNNVGTSFVATGTTPNSWGEPGESGLQYNPGAPVVTVLENTIGNIWFTYQTIGTYNINSDNLFSIGKTVCMIGNNFETGDYLGIIANTNNVSSNPTTIKLMTLSSFDMSYYDGLLLNTPIEIRVYN